ncbi:MAG: hypothetical protein LJE95_04575 [Acidobacteria bacterium]|nr:hypothetical protein [Acidobacteriota bacterium]
MNAERHAFLLVGSPRRGKSTSAALGRYLGDRLAEQGWWTGRAFLYGLIGNAERERDLLGTLREVDLVVLAAPLYVDSLPAVVTRFLELWARDIADCTDPPRSSLTAILNCGFPEAEHNHVALAICRRFAHETGLGWCRGLALGGGEAFGGRELDQVGGMARHARRALELAAAALAAGEHIPDAAVELMARPIVPRRIYQWIGNRSWRVKARRAGTLAELRARPYEANS